MEQFKKNETSVMLATPNSVRGLDFPALTHVYTLYLPMEDPREYVHLAGRVGRVGQLGTVQGDGGHVISILKEEDANQMDVLAKELGFDFTDVDASSVEDIVILNAEGKVDETMFDLEKTRRFLEDTLNLVEEAEDPVVDVDAIDAARSQYVYDDEDDDEEEDE
jgi:superfamily II DNA/RNA helicase